MGRARGVGGLSALTTSSSTKEGCRPCLLEPVRGPGPCPICWDEGVEFQGPTGFKIFRAATLQKCGSEIFLRFCLPKVSWNLAWNFGEIFRATFSRVWVCDGKFHQNFTSKTVWKMENFTQISLCWGAALKISRPLRWVPPPVLLPWASRQLVRRRSAIVGHLSETQTPTYKATIWAAHGWEVSIFPV